MNAAAMGELVLAVATILTGLLAGHELAMLVTSGPAQLRAPTGAGCSS